jgi:carbonic anhydrase
MQVRKRSLLSFCAFSLVTTACLALAPSTRYAEESAAPSTPDAAIKKLMDGNARYVAGKPTSVNPVSTRGSLVTTHAPFAAIVRCADARVSPEICFDASLGSLFVNGVAGNIITPEIIASFEYAVGSLGTKLIVVMGHRHCGAVKVAIQMRNKSDQLPGSLPMLIDQIIVPCTLDADPADVKAYEHEAVICNANKGVGQLIARSPLLAAAVEKGDLKIIAGVQDLATGKFTITQK